MPEPPCPGLFPQPRLASPTKPTTRNRKSQRRYAVSSKKISLANGVIQGLNDLHSTSPTDQNVENPLPPPLLSNNEPFAASRTAALSISVAWILPRAEIYLTKSGLQKLIYKISTILMLKHIPT